MFSFGRAGQLIRSRCLFDSRLSLLIFVIGYAILVHAQEDEPKPCTQIRLTETAVVRGYAFRAYEGKTPDDPGCMRVYRHGKLVFQLAEDEQYHLGQPADPANEIPPVSNGTDLTGTGRPDMIVTSWSGGAHCCFSHYVFELEPEFRLLATIKDGDADLAHFEDLDHDQHYYYLTSEICTKERDQSSWTGWQRW